MSVQWSHEAGCFTFSCLFGCYGFDYEGEAEARTAFLTHKCTGDGA